VKVVPNHRSDVQCNIYCDGNGSTKGMVNINFCVSFLTTLKYKHNFKKMHKKIEMFFPIPDF